MFTAALIQVLAQAANLYINRASQYRGQLVLEASTPAQGVTHFVLLADCNCDNQVKTQIRDNYASLVDAGYSSIIGLRDVYPLDATDVPDLEAALYLGLPQGGIPIYIHLAVMELESWFIAENSHFSRISPILTLPYMAQNGFDLNQVPPQQWAPAATVLDDIYMLAGYRYKKKENHVKRTIAAMSMPLVFSYVRSTVPEFDAFVTSLETALELPYLQVP